MADTINISNKPSIQIRSGLPSPLPDKSPSPATKLLISHGKPNFTIARSTSKVEDNGNPVSPQPNANNNYNAYKSANSSVSNNKFVVGTKFNGVFKPSTAAASWATNNGNGNTNGNGTSDQNEAAKVVLRRPKLADEEPLAADGDEQVPEFIRRQRRIQERLAKENVLDFENRRSGYFTHVMISPDSPNRTSFVETMASPAIVPALEMPLPAKIEEEQQQQLEEQPTTVAVENGHTETLSAISNGQRETSEVEPQPVSNGHSEQTEISNGQTQEDVAAEEVAKAIEEVNKAVAGEDDDNKPEAELVQVKAEPEHATVEVVTPVTDPEPVALVQNGDAAASTAHAEAITISHTNGHTSEVPSIATPDPSGALGVNYEPRTVISFSQELGGENNYLDTVKVVKEAPTTPADAELQEITKLKFDIKSDEQNEVQVTSVLRAE